MRSLVCVWLLAKLVAFRRKAREHKELCWGVSEVYHYFYRWGGGPNLRNNRTVLKNLRPLLKELV